MEQKESFTIKVHDMQYIIKPYKNGNDILYEVFTSCEKLFTLKKNANDSWITNEKDIIPISENIVYDIGDAIEKIT